MYVTCVTIIRNRLSEPLLLRVCLVEQFIELYLQESRLIWSAQRQITLTDSESGQSSVFEQELDDQQRKNLHLPDDFADVFGDKPGRTTLTEHTIKTGVVAQCISIPINCLWPTRM